MLGWPGSGEPLLIDLPEISGARENETCNWRFRKKPRKSDKNLSVDVFAASDVNSGSSASLRKALSGRCMKSSK